LAWENDRTALPPQSLSTLEPDTVIIASATFAPSSLAPTRLAGTGQHHPYFDVNAVKTAWMQKPELRDMRACQEGRCYFVDYMLWESIRGPLASHRILDELHTQLLTSKD
jgi:ABC-type Fe3+-hydroxamate transport system substrate-binding protein